MDVDALLDVYQVDRPHARQVADHALAIFDAVADRYGLAASRRRLVEIGGLLHNVGLTTDPPQHHLVGRDIVLRHGVDGLGERERVVLAAMIAFHRKRVRPEQEPAFLSLGKGGRREAIALAAILRVADGLDYSQSQTTRLEGVDECEGGLALRLAGPQATLDGARAVAKADLWERAFDERLHTECEPGEPAEPAEAVEAGEDVEPGEDAAAVLKPWFAAPEAPLAELGRVLLRRHLRRLLAAERKVRADKGIEAVHDLRVATRRLRAILRLLAPVGARKPLRTHRKALGRVAAAAGAVRDRDVLLADLAERAKGMSEHLQPSVEALREALAGERRQAHRQLVELLDSADHEATLKAFAGLMSGSEGWDDAPRVRDLGGSTIWRHYEALRAHDRGGIPAEDEALHQMRIEGKQMRYVLELFADTLGPRADDAVNQLVAFQDHLGGLNDVVVARGLLEPHIQDDDAGPAAIAYLALREQQADTSRAELPARWEKLMSATYRRKLLDLIVKL